MIQLSYGFATLAAIWAFGGGNIELFWPRQAILALIMIVIAVANLIYAKKIQILKPDLHSTRMGIGSGLVTAIPALLFIYYFKHKVGAPWILDLVPPNLIAVLITSLLLAPAWEILSRGFLVPAWGLGSVAFLDALTVGFGIQQLVPFLAIWIMGYLWGILATRTNLVTSVISRVVWSLLVLSGLLFI